MWKWGLWGLMSSLVLHGSIEAVKKGRLAG